MNAVVSIVLVLYNSEKTVIETLNSIYEQTYEQIELIIADDASKDLTMDVVNTWLSDFENRFCNVEIVTVDKNTGVTCNCNRGVKKASGKYIQLLAGDDILLPDAIETRVSAQKKYPNDIIVTKIDVFGESSLVRKQENWCNKGYKILQKDRNVQYKKLLKSGGYIAGPSWSFLDKNIYEKVGFYDERFPMMEDYPFLIKIMENGYQFRFINKSTIRYRVYKSSLCHSINDGASQFAVSWDKFFKLVLSNKLLKNHMFYAFLIHKITSIRFNLRIKYGEQSLLYKLSILLRLLNPDLIIDFLFERIRFWKD